MRRVGESFIEEVKTVQQDHEGNTWILRRSTAEDSNGFSKHFIEKFNPQGVLILSLQEPSGTHFNAFTIHPSGELTIAETRKIDTTEEYGKIFHIWFKRLKHDGTLITEVPLRDAGSDEEQLYYMFDWDKKYSDIVSVETIPHVVDSEDKIRTYATNEELLSSVGEEAIFLAYTHSVKLYRLKKDLQIAWNKQVMPHHNLILMGHLEAKLAVDETGNAYVAFPSIYEQIKAWKTHFKKNMDGLDIPKGILIVELNTAGELQNYRLFHQENPLSVAGFFVQNDVITLGATLKVLGKLAKHNNTHERDLLFFRAQFSTGEFYVHKIIDIQRDDYAHDFKIDGHGNGIFVGSNNFVQVDSGSFVEYGQGFALFVDKEGNKLDYVSLPGPRHTRINSFDFRKSQSERSGIVFGGRYDAPITHTADEDKSLNYQKGLLGVLE